MCIYIYCIHVTSCYYDLLCTSMYDYINTPYISPQNCSSARFATPCCPVALTPRRAAAHPRRVSVSRAATAVASSAPPAARRSADPGDPRSQAGPRHCNINGPMVIYHGYQENNHQTLFLMGSGINRRDIWYMFVHQSENKDEDVFCTKIRCALQASTWPARLFKLVTSFVSRNGASLLAPIYSFEATKNGDVLPSQMGTGFHPTHNVRQFIVTKKMWNGATNGNFVEIWGVNNQT